MLFWTHFSTITTPRYFMWRCCKRLTKTSTIFPRKDQESVRHRNIKYSQFPCSIWVQTTCRKCLILTNIYSYNSNHLIYSAFENEYSSLSLKIARWHKPDIFFVDISAKYADLNFTKKLLTWNRALGLLQRWHKPELRAAVPVLDFTWPAPC